MAAFGDKATMQIWYGWLICLGYLCLSYADALRIVAVDESGLQAVTATLPALHWISWRRHNLNRWIDQFGRTTSVRTKFCRWILRWWWRHL